MADDAAESELPPLYDTDLGLRELARARGRRDGATRSSAQLGDRMAEYLNRHFSPEETETAGRALLIAASCAGFLVAEGLDNPAALLNIFGFAAGRLVTDGRAWTDARETEKS